MRRNYKPNPKQSAAIARMQYKNRQVDKFVKWSIEQKGYLKYRELIEFERLGFKCRSLPWYITWDENLPWNK